MIITVLIRNITDIKIFCDNRAAGSRKKSGFRADAEFLNAGRHCEFLICKAFVDTVHHFAPESLVEFPGIVVRKLLIVVEARPYCTGIIGSIAYEPEIVVVIRSTCFAGYCHIVKLAGRTGSFCYNIFHGIREKPCGAFFDHGTFCGGFFDQYISVVIQDLGVINRFNIVAAVGDRRISRAQFHIGNTMGQTAKSHGQVGVCPYVSVGVSVGLCTMGQRSESEVVQILQSKFGSNLFQTFYCNYVDGVLNSSPDGSGASITQGGVLHR